jgi:hypothetical protein
MPDDTRLREDTFVVMVLILGKLLQAEDDDKGRYTTEDHPAKRALNLFRRNVIAFLLDDLKFCVVRINLVRLQKQRLGGAERITRLVKWHSVEDRNYLDCSIQRLRVPFSSGVRGEKLFHLQKSSPCQPTTPICGSTGDLVIFTRR